ncbi:hypothetical protein B0H13DRAFT_2385649 [Mycena leptocephala]|nr:hypothetical protein B0H13DRAFT_2385649 [Mycena leptocephala]
MSFSDGSFAATKELAIRLVALLHAGIPSNEHTETEKALKLLSDDLDLADSVLQRTAATSLPPFFAYWIREEVLRCHSTVAQFLIKLTTCKGPSQQMYSSESEDTLLKDLRMQIMQRRAALDVAVGLLNSGAWGDRESNNHIRELTMIGGVGGMGGTGANGGTGGIGEGPRLIGEYFFVGNLVVNQIERGTIPRAVSDHIFYVIDPVGGHIPVSLRYCHVYADLDRIIKAYLAGRPDAGARFVERGDYGVVFEDGSFIAPVDFAERVGAGMRLEMSILQLQIQNESDAIHNTVCPHCSSPQATETRSGWYKCANEKCLRNYRIDSQDQTLEHLVSPQLAEPDRRQTQIFRRVHICLILVGEPVGFLVG